MRLALGASRSRLARQFLIENLVLTFAGAALGVVLAVAALRGLLALAPPSVPRLEPVSLNVRVLGLTLGLAIVTGLDLRAGAAAAGLAARPAGDAQERGPARRLDRSRRGRRAQRVLVVGELALAVMLVIGASLLVRSVSQVMQVDAGFHTTGVMKAEYQLPASRYPVDFRKWPNLVEIHAFTARLLQRASSCQAWTPWPCRARIRSIRASPTRSRSSAAKPSRTTGPSCRFAASRPATSASSVSRLSRGRLLRDADTTTATPVLVINQAAAARFFEGREPLGARIRFWGVTWTSSASSPTRSSTASPRPTPSPRTRRWRRRPRAGPASCWCASTGDPATGGPAIAGVVRRDRSGAGGLWRRAARRHAAADRSGSGGSR